MQKQIIWLIPVRRFVDGVTIFYFINLEKIPAMTSHLGRDFPLFAPANMEGLWYIYVALLGHPVVYGHPVVCGHPVTKLMEMFLDMTGQSSMSN